MTVAICKKLKKKQGLTKFIGEETCTLSNIQTATSVFSTPDSDWLTEAKSKSEAENKPFYIIEEGLFASYSMRHDDGITLSALVSPNEKNKRKDAAHADCFADNSFQSEKIDKFIKLWKANSISWRNDRPEYSDSLPEHYLLGVIENNDLHTNRGVNDAVSLILDRMIADNKNHEDAEYYLIVDVELYDEACRVASSWEYKLFEIKIIKNKYHVCRLITMSYGVYVFNSLAGLDVLIRGGSVVVIDRPFYVRDGLKEVLAEYIFEKGRYWHPEKNSIVPPGELIKWLALQRKHRFRFCGDIYALNFSRWKTSLLRNYFQGAEIIRVKSPSKIPPSAKVAVWGSMPLDRRGACGESATVMPLNTVIRVEDAFIRSIGLGAKLIRPISWVLDDTGLYYDSRSPSGLEQILSKKNFSEDLLARSRCLRKRLVEEKITKYNVGTSKWHAPNCKSKIILVPGQVEDDASIKFGAQMVYRNIDLLKSVRQDNPDSYIVYKPHPDVLEKLREEGKGEAEATLYCDEIVSGCSIAQLLDDVDEVHVMTSLAGFEALLRDKKVITYGQPFYSSWGLTYDKSPLERRQRKLTIDELIAGTLFLYPTYVSLRTGYYMTPEDALDQLLEWRDKNTYNQKFHEMLAVKIRRYVFGFSKKIKKVILGLR